MGVRLGGRFARLWAASAVSNLGDGVALAAGPLLLVTLTDDPALVAGAVFVQQLPWLLFSLPAGVFVDRWDRRTLIVVVNLGRAAVIGALTAAVAVGVAGIVVVYVAFFLVGTMETLADNASVSLVPSVVTPAQLPRANARLIGVQLVGNRLVAPPLGAALFVVAAAVPFGVNAAGFLLAALLVACLRGVPRPEPSPRRALHLDLTVGVRALMAHPVLRMLAVCLCIMNVTLDGTLAILVLYARERLGLGEVGFGILLAASGVGGIMGSAVVGRLQARFGTAWLLRLGLVIETATHLSLATTRTPWIAILTLVVFGVHASVWNVVTLSWRQRVVPDALRGRVTSVYYLFAMGGAGVGALAGGLLARELGITAPFWVAFGGMTLLTILAWRRFSPAVLDDPDPAPVTIG